MRLLVLGATGHLGQAIVRHALERGRSVTAVTRRHDPLALRGLDVTIARFDPGAFSQLAAGHEVLIDAAAPYPLDPCIPGSPAWRHVIEACLRHTRAVLDAARANRIPLVFISSFTTLPRPDSPFTAMEAAWRRSTYPYFEAKAAMEQAVLAAGEGLSAVIINPAACLGPWEFRAEGSSFVRLVMARRLPAVMDQPLSVIDVRDVAEAIDRALHCKFFGRPIPLAGHNLSLAALAAQITALHGSPAPAPVPIDPRMASIAAFWTSAAFAAFNQSAPDLWRAIPLIADGFPMQPSPDQIAIGLNLRPLSDTLRDAIAFHRGSLAF
ncbi:MAG TPA: NAD-dependent epimerase/dehydratase family protein [Terracidiphilus sp.]